MLGPDAGFLKPIHDSPDDDAPRLLYADLLDEDNQSARAEFIRIQLALAKLPAHDRRRIELARREDRLLARYAEEWAAPFKGLALGPVFRRGFVESVKVSARQFVHQAEALFDAGPVREIHLIDVGSHLRAVLESPWLRKLTGLVIFAQHLGEPLA